MSNTGTTLVYDDGNWSVSPLTRLRVLRVASTNITDAALATLPPSLHVLDLEGCNMLSAAASVAHLTCLHTLSLRNWLISSIEMLAALPPSLVSLDICGARMLTPATVFPHLPALRLLNVSHTGLSDAAVASMPAGLEELHMVCCRSVTPRASVDRLVALRVLQSAGTDLSRVATEACRARECFAPVDDTLVHEEVSLLVPLPDGRLVSGTPEGRVTLWKVAAERVEWQWLWVRSWCCMTATG